MKLDELPNDILLEIISRFDLVSTRNCALTFNRKLFHNSVGKLDKIYNPRKQILRRFRKFDRSESLEIFLEDNPTLVKWLLKSPVPSEILQRIPSFLIFDGSFQWLARLEQVNNHLLPRHGNEDYQYLMNSLRDLGLSLPSHVLHFFQDSGFRRRIPSPEYNYCFSPDGGIYRFPSQGHRMQGHAIGIQYVENEGKRAFLYIDGRGGEAVLSAYKRPCSIRRFQQMLADSVDEDERKIAAEGNCGDFASMMRVEGISVQFECPGFEEFVFRTFMFGWLNAFEYEIDLDQAERSKVFFLRCLEDMVLGRTRRK